MPEPRISDQKLAEWAVVINDRDRRDIVRWKPADDAVLDLIDSRAAGAAKDIVLRECAAYLDISLPTDTDRFNLMDRVQAALANTPLVESDAQQRTFGD